MKFLFVHQNFPGQYTHVIRHLQDAGHAVVFITQRRDHEIAGIRMLEYLPAPILPGTQSYVNDLDGGVMNGLAVARLCEGLKQEGFTPDIVVGHTGWSELLFVKDIWPSVPLLGYFEFFYRSSGSDLDFDPEFPVTMEDALRVRVRNATNMLSLNAADWGHTPTKWQRNQYPVEYHHRISVIHEGVNTERVRPDPKAQIVIVGGDGISYGRPPVGGTGWRQHMLAELGGRLDLSRIHFVGWLPYAQYLAVLQVSSAHVYLTYPFVLSWGLLEAMAAECLVIGSRTPPVEEVIDGATNGYLFDFFDSDALAEQVCSVLQNPRASAAIRRQARRYVVERFDVQTICLPGHLALLSQLTGSDLVPRPRKRRAAAARPELAPAR